MDGLAEGDAGCDYTQLSQGTKECSTEKYAKGASKNIQRGTPKTLNFAVVFLKKTGTTNVSFAPRLNTSTIFGMILFHVSAIIN